MRWKHKDAPDWTESVTVTPATALCQDNDESDSDSDGWECHTVNLMSDDQHTFQMQAHNDGVDKPSVWTDAAVDYNEDSSVVTTSVTTVYDANMISKTTDDTIETTATQSMVVNNSSNMMPRTPKILPDIGKENKTREADIFGRSNLNKTTTKNENLDNNDYKFVRLSRSLVSLIIVIVIIVIVLILLIFVSVIAKLKRQKKAFGSSRHSSMRTYTTGTGSQYSADSNYR